MHMKSANSSIKFTYEHSQQEVVFMDVVVHKKPRHRKDEDATLQTRTHAKLINPQTNNCTSDMTPTTPQYRQGCHNW